MESRISLRNEPVVSQDGTPVSGSIPSWVAPSQAKLRLEAMAGGKDQKLACAFTAMFALYAFITFGTWMHIESQEFSSPVMHAVGTSHTRAGATANGLSVSAPAAQIQDLRQLQKTFPVHIGNDMEEIDHPGMLLANKGGMAKVLEKHPLLPRDGKMKVPRFWNPSAYGEKGVRGFLGDHGQRLISEAEASHIGSFDPLSELETIYVSVASYRDPECRNTVEDIFLRAEHPERIRVAIIDQRAENDEVPKCEEPARPCVEDADQAICRYQHLIDPFEVPAQLSVGPVFARHLANRMYRGKHIQRAYTVCVCRSSFSQLTLVP